MSEISLTQKEAENLIALEKHWELWGSVKGHQPLDYPSLGGVLSVPLICHNQREHFILDIWRARLLLTKETKQLRGRQVIPLLRLDVGGRPHRNPDNEEVASPHLHIYREGYADKWAIPVPEEKFQNLNDVWQTLQDFLTYCNITKPPKFNMGLF